MTENDQVVDLILFLEWLDANEVAKWRNDTATHEDVAKAYLEGN